MNSLINLLNSGSFLASFTDAVKALTLSLLLIIQKKILQNKFKHTKTGQCNGIKKTRNTKLSNHFALRYRGKFQAIKIFDWLYSNPKHYLNRKYNQYLEIKRSLSL